MHHTRIKVYIFHVSLNKRQKNVTKLTQVCQEWQENSCQWLEFSPLVVGHLFLSNFAFKIGTLMQNYFTL